MLTQETQIQYVERATQHQKADEIAKGFYWENGKGCCVGCLAHVNDNAHKALAEQTGVPEWLHHVADTIHEGLPDKKMKQWPVRYTKAWAGLIGLTDEQINIKVRNPFLIIVLESALESFNHEEYPDVKEAINTVIELYRNGETDLDKFRDAAYAADAAAYAARAAYAAANAAAYAARAAYAAANAAYAADAADAAKYKYFADKLIELMEQANAS